MHGTSHVAIPSASTSDTASNEDIGEDHMNIYKKNACKVVKFRIVIDADDLDSKEAIEFKPEMAYQVFGDSESIFGFKKISITLNYLHNSCHLYLDMKTEGEIQSDTMKADDVIKALETWIPEDYTRDHDQFLSILNSEDHKMIYGEVIQTFYNDRHPRLPCEVSFKITRCDNSDPEVVTFHSRLQTYITWFIDAANYIELEDEKWLIYYLYEEFVHVKSGKLIRSPVAFCTVYRFYSYPDRIRPRVSQFFVLPPYQKKGLGTIFYETVSKDLRKMDIVSDITVEVPTPIFQQIRDLEDCGLVYVHLKKRNMRLNTVNSKSIYEIGKQLKIGKKQIQRIHDILRLYHGFEDGDAEHKSVLNNIKSRITEEQERESKPGKRFCALDRSVLTSLKSHQKDVIEACFKRYCEEIEPSAEYLKVKLSHWLERNES